MKAENESIYYNIDQIHKAIQDNAPITFTYLKWNSKKELEPRRDGKRYEVSPWALTWKDENYYLIAYDDRQESIKHFRVDKMSRISELSKESRKGGRPLRGLILRSIPTEPSVCSAGKRKS